MLEHVNDENFEEEIIYSDKPVVVDFWSNSCKPCSQFAPTFKALSTKYEGRVKFLKCDVVRNKAITNLFNIKSVPSVLFFCEGKIVDRITGNYNANEFEKNLKKLLEGCKE